MSLPHGHGVASVEPPRSSTGVDVELTLEDARDLTPAVARLRRLFDLDADPMVVDEHLAADALLAPLVAASPGRRVPGSVDVFETAVRAIVGQQISIAGARTVTGRIVRALGEPLRPSLAAAAAPCELVFPSPDAVAAAAPDVFAMPGRRKASIVALGRAVVDGELCLGASITRAELASQLLALPGIGPWTAEYIAMRGRGDPDAYLPTDLGVVRAIAELRGATVDPQRWRPWRACALHHLWAIPHGAV
ncbi:MAG: AlkA N-terminal domain-containing protein [Ilumatobacteraceae bacterium]